MIAFRQGDLEDSNAPIERSRPAPLDAALFGLRDEQYYDNMDDLKRRLGLEIAAEEEELGGDHRIAVDNLLARSDCEALMELARVSSYYLCVYRVYYK